MNIVDCLLSLGANEEISRQLQDLVQKLPELIEKVLPVAKDKAGLLLSAYLAYKSLRIARSDDGSGNKAVQEIST